MLGSPSPSTEMSTQGRVRFEAPNWLGEPVPVYTDSASRFEVLSDEEAEEVQNLRRGRDSALKILSRMLPVEDEWLSGGRR